MTLARSKNAVYGRGHPPLKTLAAHSSVQILS